MNKGIKAIGIFIIIAIISISSLNIYKLLNHSIYNVENNYIADFSDIKKVSGFSDNIFIGKVLENLGPDEGESGLPVKNTKFKIQVIYNIKGKIKGNINVIQEAGYDNLGNLFISEGNNYLSIGNIYILITKGDNYTILSHPNGNHLISSDVKNKNDLKKIIKENNKISEFKKAYKDELYYEENENGEKYKISSEKNAYKNLTKEEKQKIEIFENGFTE